MDPIITTPPKKPRRRWFRFSLRTLLVAITLLCIWLGLKVNAIHQERKTIAAILRIGGAVDFDYQHDPSRQWIDNAQPPGPKWLRQLFGDECFASIYSVHCTPGVTDELLERLHHQTKLQFMTLYGGDLVTDRGFASVADITSLIELHQIGCQQLTDAGLAHFHQLKNLETLRIINCPQLSDAGLELLKKLPGLQLLVIDGPTRVSSSGITSLRKSLPDCRIHLMRTPLVELNDE